MSEITIEILSYSALFCFIGFVCGDALNSWRNKKEIKRLTVENKYLIDARENYLRYLREKGIASEFTTMEQLTKEVNDLRKIVAQNKFKGSGKK